ncbi:hypothetical protein [uncultured Flavobacterium sp.]|nr:hypothetical protein [uncultured Flavobacterium sp.]
MILISAAGSCCDAGGLIILLQADLMQRPAMVRQLVCSCKTMKYTA